MRLYIPVGPLPPGTEEAVEAAWRGESALVAPELLLAEVGAVLAKKERSGVITPDEADAVLTAILGLPIRLIPHRALLPHAMRVARTTGVTVYDALFISAAVEHGGTLVTADSELRRAGDRIAHNLR